MEFKKSTKQKRVRRSSSTDMPVVLQHDTAPSPVVSQQSSFKQSILASKKNIAIGVLIVSALALFAGIFWHQQQTNQKSDTKNAPVTATAPQKNESVLPSGKSVEQLGGWKRVSPAGSAPVFAYADTIDGVTISVSQQPLPDSFKTSTDSHIADLAKKFNATTKIDARGITAYLGNSSQGPQSIIVTKKDVLILIKSQKKIDDKSWINYIAALN